MSPAGTGAIITDYWGLNAYDRMTARMTHNSFHIDNWKENNFHLDSILSISKALFTIVSVKMLDSKMESLHR